MSTSHVRPTPQPALWAEAEVVAFDTETTGIDVHTDRIVTAALVTRQGISATSTTQVQRWLLDPGVTIPAGASAVHGITTEFAQKNGQASADGIDQIATALANLAGRGVPVIAFNAAYDLALLNAELLRHSLPTLKDRMEGTPLFVVDPLVLDRAVNRYRKGKRTLEALCAGFEVEVADDLHDAATDATATIDVLAKLVAQHPSLASRSLAELYTYQQQAHREWAENFNEWLARKGRNDGPSTSWL